MTPRGSPLHSGDGVHDERPRGRYPGHVTHPLPRGHQGVHEDDAERPRSTSSTMGHPQVRERVGLHTTIFGGEGSHLEGIW